MASLVMNAVLNKKANPTTNYACWTDMRRARNAATARLSKCCKLSDPKATTAACKALAAHLAPKKI
jgi:hypothetical protein